MHIEHILFLSSLTVPVYYWMVWFPITAYFMCLVKDSTSTTQYSDNDCQWYQVYLRPRYLKGIYYIMLCLLSWYNEMYDDVSSAGVFCGL